MSEFIITYKFDSKNRASYVKRLTAFKDFLKKVCPKYNEDDTTSTIMCQIPAVLYDAKSKKGLAYALLETKILNKDDTVLFIRFVDGKLARIGRISDGKMTFETRLERVFMPMPLQNKTLSKEKSKQEKPN